MQGQIIDNKYQVIRQLGEGGMGAVYEARHTGTGRRVALKVIVAQALAQGADIITRFQREARASGAIESEHVVQVLDTGVDGSTGNPYMVMELLSGEDIQQLIRRVGPIAPDLALRLLSHACLGLKRAHDAGIIHRDIKSANLFISKRDSGDAIVKILDFGIAKVRADQLAQAGDHGLTRTGSMIGSPLYMSPEQALGLKTLDGRGDIWSLGVVLYETLCGRTPHAECETIGQLLIAINSGKFKPVQDLAPWVPAEVASIVHKAMSHEPGDRFQTAAEMHAAIFALLPNGAVISQASLAPMPDAMRATVAPRITPTVSGADRSGPQSPLAASIAISSPGTSSPNIASANVQSTTGGFGASQAPAGVPRKSALRWALPLVGGVAVLGTLGTYAALSRQKAAAITPVASESTAALPSSSQQALPSSRRTVQVTITPSDARVDVDGVVAVVHDGKIDVTGDIGSVHRVHVVQNGNEKWDDVVIAETGARPNLVSALKDTVAVTPTPTRQTQHGGVTVVTPTAAASSAPVTAPTVTAAPQTTKTTKPSTTPAIDRSM